MTIKNNNADADAAVSLHKIIGSAAIVAGTAVGAGMFSMPITISGIWYIPGLFLLVLVWFCTYSAALYILEATLRFPRGASFDTVSQGLFGPWMRFFNGGSILFVCYVLTYAYISGGGSIVKSIFLNVSDQAIPGSLASLLFSVVLSGIIFIGIKAVDRLSVILLVSMVLSFLLFSLGLLKQSDSHNLFLNNASFMDHWQFTLIASIFVTVSFGYQNCVPSLVAYLKADAHSSRKAILWGSLAALFFYVIWLTTVFGVLPRNIFPSLVQKGGNIGVMINALNSVGSGWALGGTLQFFANMAVISSFLGVGLSLFDYISDLFGFDKNLMSGRIKTGLITFVPPTLLGVIAPDGFLKAIVFAGFGMTIFAIIVPALLGWRSRIVYGDDKLYKVSGGHFRIGCVLLFGICMSILAILDAFSLLPWYGK